MAAEADIGGALLVGTLPQESHTGWRLRADFSWSAGTRSQARRAVLTAANDTCTNTLYNSPERVGMETTFSQLRGNLKSYCEQAVANREAIRVRRRNGRDVVLLAADEYDSLADTAHLLSSPRNAARLLAALARARKKTV